MKKILNYWKWLALASLVLLAYLFYQTSRETPDFYELTTNTGFQKVYFVEDKEADEFRGEVILLRGEADSQGREGIAHYLEHLVAANAFPARDELFKNDFNATTSGYLTNYFMNSPEIEPILEYLSAVFSPIELDEDFMREEVGIVKQEYEFRLGQDKSFLAINAMRKNIMNNHEITRSTIGEPSLIEEFTFEEALALHEESYYTGNAILVFYGNKTPKKMTKLINQAFAQNTRKEGRKRSFTDIDIPDQQDEIFINEHLVKDAFVLEYYFSLNELTEKWPDDPNEAMQEILARTLPLEEFLNSAKAGAFQRKMVHEDKLFSGVYSEFIKLPENLGFILQISATPKPNVKADLREEFEKYAHNILNELDHMQAFHKENMDNYQKLFDEIDALDIYNSIRDDIYRNWTKATPLRPYLEEAKKVTSETRARLLLDVANNARQIYITYQKEA